MTDVNAPLDPNKDLGEGKEDYGDDNPNDARGIGGIPDEELQTASDLIDDAERAVGQGPVAAGGAEEVGASTPLALARAEDSIGAGNLGEGVEPETDPSNERYFGHGSGGGAPEA